MKSFKIHFTFAAAAFAAVAGLTGCQDNFDVPPLDIPVATMQSNTTIAELKEAFWDDANNYATLVEKKANGEDYIIKGRVISSDASGNIYKSLVIQDETGALPMSINQNSLYNSYRVGQEIVVNVTDIYCGKYAGYEQIGGYGESKQGEPQTSFMDYALFTSHAELNGLPNPELTYVQPDAERPSDGIYCLVADMGSLPSSGDPAGIRAWQGQLVEFRGVHFEGGGELTYANADNNDNVSRKLLDSKGNDIVVRNSGYASFKGEMMPAGTGNVRGILSYFNGTWQVLLRTTADVMFDTKGSQSDPYTVAEAIEQQGNGIIGWTEGYIVGSVKGGVSNVASNSDIIWSADAEMDNTLVIGATKDTKDIAECLVVNLPQSSAFRQYGNLVENPGVYGKYIKVYGALESNYGINGITGNTGSASEFEIEGVTIGGGSQPGPVTAVPSLFCDFNSYSADIKNLVNKAGWTIAHTSGDRDWFLKEFSGNTYASANAYKATGGPWEMWLISPAIDIDKSPKKTLEFISQAAYNPGSSEIQVYVLEGNDPKTAKKTVLNATFAVAPESGYSTWVNSGTVDLSSFSGTIYIGWCYKASDANASTTYCIDDVNIGGASTSGGGSDDPVTPPAGGGAGSEAEPYNVTFVASSTSDVTGVWVEGYVVGYVIGTKWNGGATFSNDLTGVNETSDSGYANTNLILATSANVNTTASAIPVQLSSSARPELGLRTNPAIYMKHVKLKGDITKYFGTRGLKGVAEYKILD